MAKICENTLCAKPVGGALVGLSRQFCAECEGAAQNRVIAYRKLVSERRTKGL